MPTPKLPLQFDQPVTVAGAAPGLTAFLAPPNDPQMVARMGEEKILRHQSDGMILEGERFKTRDGGWIQGRRYLALDPSNGTPIGAANVTLRKEGRKVEAVLSNIVVDPAFRRRGVASRLIQQALENYPKLRGDNTMTEEGAALMGHAQDEPTPVLVIVHPGSACGSAEMNLGRDGADYQRGEMQLAVEDWQGAVVVIDGELSEELEGYRSTWSEWGNSIQQALERAKKKGLLALRVRGDDAEDYNQQAAIADVVKNHGMTPANTTFTLTGAWVDEDGGGCVHSVREVLERLGFTPQLDSPMDLDFSLDSEEELDEEPAVTSPSRRPRLG